MQEKCKIACKMGVDGPMQHFTSVHLLFSFQSLDLSLDLSLCHVLVLCLGSFILLQDIMSLSIVSKSKYWLSRHKV